MNEETTNSKLREIIRTTLDMGENQVRPANQNAPIYKGEQYVTVQIVSEVSEGWDETSFLPIEGEELFADERVWGQRLVRAQIQYYNGDAMAQLRRLSQRLQSQSGVQLFEQSNFGFSRATITDLTGLLPDEEWQTRALLQLEFYAVMEDHVRVPLIVKVPLTTHTGRETITEIVPPQGDSIVSESAAPTFLAFETGGGETVRLREVIP